MPADPKQEKALAAVREAQARFERDAEAVRAARREAFTEARSAGLTLRQIGEVAGLHHTTVGEIIRGEQR
jgi:DNA-directed RNA polymerase specialized sigma24 family protein